MNRLTNKHGLPAIVVRAVERMRSEYDRGESDITATELVGPPRIARFMTVHRGDIHEDVTDRMAAWYGHVIHAAIEREHHGHHDLVEARLYEGVLGWRVGGKFDHYDHEDGGTLRDWKFTKVGAYTFNPSRVSPEYEAQANVNARLLRINGFPVSRIEIGYCFKDFNRNAARRSENYPRAEMACVQVRDWGLEKQRAYMEARVRIHQAARLLEPEAVSLCTEAERWERTDHWAVKREGRKDALKRFYVEGDAERYMISENLDPKKHWVERRLTEPTRCLDWCPARTICSHGRKVASESRS